MSDKLCGGWVYNESVEPWNIPPKMKEIFKKAFTGLLGVTYEPVLYVGEQTVAGKNYCMICKAKTVAKEPKTDYKTVYIYEDLNGEISITAIEDVIS